MTAVGTALVITRTGRTPWRTGDWTGRILRAVGVVAVCGAVAVIVDSIVANQLCGGRITAILRAADLGFLSVAYAVTAHRWWGRCVAIHATVVAVFLSFAYFIATAEGFARLSLVSRTFINAAVTGGIAAVASGIIATAEPTRRLAGGYSRAIV